uniref:Neprosin PEP catalytic domain-containing protein n=1 Tax=Leersia perrieri TaxID=77586 RepID=A0A0D9XR73_9ORYZ
MTLYNIWEARNEVRFEEKRVNPTVIANRICFLLDEWANLDVQKRTTVPSPTPSWQLPATGWAKLNADGAWSSQRGCGAAGVIVRDDSGRFLAASVHFFPCVLDAISAEIKATSRAVELAAELRLSKVLIETDSTKVLRLLAEDGRGRSIYAMQILDLKLKARQIRNVEFAWVRRSANRVAIRLVKEGVQTHCVTTWVSTPPVFLMSLLNEDSMRYIRWTTKTFLLLQLLTFRVDPTMEEIDNNLIIKKVQSAHGQTFACVNFESQPSLRHPLLKNHTIQLKQRNSIFHGTYDDNRSMFYISNVEMSEIECPPGTIPVLTSYNGSMSTILFDKTIGFNENGNENVSRQVAALATMPSTFHGLVSSLSVWEPDLGTGKPPRFSGAIAIVQNEESRVAAGWSVDPRLYGDNHVHFEIAWVDHGKACVNVRCAGFVQMSRKVIPGAIIKPVSTIDGKKYIIRIKIVKFLGDWVLKFGEEIVGYWPGKLFSQMSDYATSISWMGIVGAAPGEPFPPMGSGESPDQFEGETKAAYIADVNVVDASGNIVTPALSTLNTIVTAPKCYEIGHVFNSGGGLKFSFGGKGCSPSQPIK